MRPRTGGREEALRSTRDVRQTALTRTDFFIALGCSAVAIAGSFFVQRTAPTPTLQRPARLTPQLCSDTEIGTLGDLVLMRRKQSASVHTCAVNALGAFVIQKLDGTRTVREIAQCTAEAASLEWSEALEAHVASFVAELGIHGFLRDPFYACIVEEQVTA